MSKLYFEPLHQHLTSKQYRQRADWRSPGSAHSHLDKFPGLEHDVPRRLCHRDKPTAVYTDHRAGAGAGAGSWGGLLVSGTAAQQNRTSTDIGGHRLFSSLLCIVVGSKQLSDS